MGGSTALPHTHPLSVCEQVESFVFLYILVKKEKEKKYTCGLMCFKGVGVCNTFLSIRSLNDLLYCCVAE